MGSVVATRTARAGYDVLRRRLEDGFSTTIHVVRFPRDRTSVRVQHFERPVPLDDWCAENGVQDALAGGFFVRPAGPSLGEVWIGGDRVPSAEWRQPFARTRAAVHCDGAVTIGPRDVLPAAPTGDLLQAGPLLVHDGASIVGRDPEGFASDAAQFDSDITAGRYPRTALGVSDDTYFAVTCEGRRTGVDAGLTLTELADVLRDVGAVTALNLDGGGSTALIHHGHLLNRPYDAQDRPIRGCRPVLNALVFVPR